MIYTTYDPITGQIQATYNTQDDVLPANAVTGSYTDKDYYWNGTQMVAKPRDPSGVVKYTFDWTTKSWQIDVESSKTSVKKVRDEMLQTVDRVNPIWYATLSQQQQQELQAYRQALLDVPQQAGFPGAVEWPSKPQWL